MMDMKKIVLNQLYLGYDQVPGVISPPMTTTTHYSSTQVYIGIFAIVPAALGALGLWLTRCRSPSCCCCRSSKSSQKTSSTDVVINVSNDQSPSPKQLNNNLNFSTRPTSPLPPLPPMSSSSSASHQSPPNAKSNNISSHNLMNIGITDKQLQKLRSLGTSRECLQAMVQDEGQAWLKRQSPRRKRRYKIEISRRRLILSDVLGEGMP